MVYTLILSYRGGGYAGWQRQANALSVQEAVEGALTDLLQEPVSVFGAGRTDAGVHARGQVAHLTLDREFPLEGLQHGSNQRLPEDIRVVGAFRMADGFHARKSALAKEYRYRIQVVHPVPPIDSMFSVWYPGPLDLEQMSQAARALLGEHDFTAFALAGGSHGQPRRRIFEASWTPSRNGMELRLVGNGFLRGMVRSIVGTLVEVGHGKRSVAEFRDLLGGRERSQAGPTAPAHGLVLERVIYPPPWDHCRLPGSGGVLD